MAGFLHALDLHTFAPGDLLIILVLVVLEGLLSCDNAVVLALLVKHLPEKEQGKALRYGIIGAYIFRIVALSLATVIMRVWWLKAAGGLYLGWLAIDFFRKKAKGEGEHEHARTVKPILGLSVFWSTVITVELTDIVFSVDSIAAAVALSGKLYILIIGGMLGILAMRFAAQGFLVLLEKFPRLESAAFVAVGFIGLKLLLEVPVDVFGRSVELPATVAYDDAAEYRAAVDQNIAPVIDLAHAIRINSAAPPAPDEAKLAAAAEKTVRAEQPALAGEALAEAVKMRTTREVRDAESSWNLQYRPLIHLAGPVSSAIVLVIFGFGFIRRATPT